ncbi:MAG: aldo/keto reductase [Pseudomonadales bacterium]
MDQDFSQDSRSPVTGTSRRRFFQYAAAVGIGAQTLMRSGDVRAAVFDAKESVALPWPEMRYRTLGRTGFEASRLIYGCGAALMRRPNDRLLNTALEAGINVFDVGTSRYYDMAERNLKNFLAANRKNIFLISKSFIPEQVQPDDDFSVADAQAAAKGWLSMLDESLSELGVEQVDAYYLMGSNNVRVIGSEEIYRAFQSAKAAGKARFFGLSTHQNAHAVLEKAIETGWYDLAMIAITPGGWYDWETKKLLPGTPSMVELRPLLDRARAAGIGMIGMKAARYIAGRGFLGGGNADAFDGHYQGALLQAKLSSFQRSYAYVLEHGLDCVNADIQNYDQLKENYVAAATSSEYFNATA